MLSNVPERVKKLFIFSDLIGHTQRSDHSEYERDVLCILHESLPNLPITSAELIDQLRKNLNADVCSSDIHKILEKLAAQDIVKLVSSHICMYF